MLLAFLVWSELSRKLGKKSLQPETSSSKLLGIFASFPLHQGIHLHNITPLDLPHHSSTEEFRNVWRARFPSFALFQCEKIANVTIFRLVLLPDLHPEDWGHILRLRPGNASGPRHSLPDLFNYFFNEVWVLLKCDVSCAVVCTPRENKLSNLRKSHKSASNRVVLFRSQKTVPTYQMIVRGPTITDSTVRELLS